ncbi:D-hexose-6-phosphate mutarotase [archaeon]|nr:MAG: D-hexose-6-phosphate mutarotase [archaeon]
MLSVAMSSGAERLTGNGGLPFIRVSFDASHCDVYLWGATLTSWVHRGSEQLYLSGLAVFDGVKAIRGGIPLVFPQFGQPDLAMAQHGFARTKVWTFLGHSADDHQATALFSLQHDEHTLSLWPHSFHLLYEVRVSPEGLVTTLHVLNTGDQPCSFQALLHTYLRVAEVSSVTVRGLRGLHFLDKLDAGGGSPQETRDQVRIEGEVDRVYTGSTQPVSLQDSTGLRSLTSSAVVTEDTHLGGLLAGEEGQVEAGGVAALLRHLHSAPGGSEQEVDVVLWNAWEARSRALPDLDDDAYLGYVCLEPGLVVRTPCLLPAQRLALSQQIRFL